MKPFTSEVTGTPYLNNMQKICEKNCPDYNGMEILHREQCDCICHDTPTLGKDSPDLKFFVENVKKAFTKPFSLHPNIEYHIRQLLDYLEPFL